VKMISMVKIALSEAVLIIVLTPPQNSSESVLKISLELTVRVTRRKGVEVLTARSTTA